MKFIVGLVACFTMACGLSTQQAAKDVVTLENVTCNVAAQQPNEPEFEQFICSVLDSSGTVTQTFLAKVPASQSDLFAKAHMAK